jgi:hypothetical protein
MAKEHGRWVELPRHLYATDVSCSCDFCGKRACRRYLGLEEQGRSFRFCNEECVELWYEYWLPRYGAKIGLVWPSRAHQAEG